MKALRVGDDGFKLELAVADDVIAIVGRRGRGKTTTAVVLVEELHAAGARFCVLDPVGVWWGLKSSKDGKAAGIPVVVMGGEHADVPLEDTAGKVIADFVADPASPSVVLDFRGFRKGQIVRFATDFLEQLYHRNRAPLHLVLDEADQFAPQRVMGEVARLVGAAEDVCKMGRARGLHPIVITQRPAALNKNVLTQAGLLVAHALTGPQDQKAVDEWIRANAEEGQRTKFLETIPGLLMGVAWFWQPTIPIFRQVHVRDRRTFDSSATPKEGQVRAPKVLAEVDLEELKKRIASTIEKAKAEDPKELRRQLAEVRAQLAKAAAAKPAITPPVTGKPKVREVPVLKDAQVKRLEAEGSRLERMADRLNETVTAIAAQFQQIRAALAAAREAPKGAVVGVGRPSPAPAGLRPAPVVPRPPRVNEERGNGSGQLGKGELKILAAIAQHGAGVTREQLTVLTGYKRSSRDTYLQRLRAADHIAFQGDTIHATTVGVGALGRDYEPLPTGDALRAHWLDRLPEGERRIFSAVAESYPNPVTRAALDYAVGYKRSSRDTYIQRLTARCLVRPAGAGEIRAADELFG